MTLSTASSTRSMTTPLPPIPMDRYVGQWPFLGEHHLGAKRLAYEEAIRVPLRVHIPGHAPENLPQLAANIDIAPTLLDWAGDPSTHNANGTSLVPVINGTATTWRTNLLLENWEQYHWHGLRTNRYTYVRWAQTHHQELYDLRHDPQPTPKHRPPTSRHRRQPPSQNESPRALLKRMRALPRARHHSALGAVARGAG